jgi:hypothetical protein
VSLEARCRLQVGLLPGQCRAWQGRLRQRVWQEVRRGEWQWTLARAWLRDMCTCWHHYSVYDPARLKPKGGDPWLGID